MRFLLNPGWIPDDNVILGLILGENWGFQQDFKIYGWRVGHVSLYWDSEGRLTTQPTPTGFRGGHPSSTAIGVGSLANWLRSDQLGWVC